MSVIKPEISYISNLIDPLNTEPVSVPDDQLRPHIIRSLNIATTLNVSPQVNTMLVWFYHSNKPVIRVYTGVNQGLFGLNRVLAPQEVLYGQYEYFRPISGLVTVRSATQSTTNVALSGVVNAIDFNTPLRINNLNFENILRFGINQGSKVQSVLLAEGLASLMQPRSGEYMLPMPYELPAPVRPPFQLYPVSPFPTFNRVADRCLVGEVSNPTPPQVNLIVIDLPDQPFGRIRVQATARFNTTAVGAIRFECSYRCISANALGAISFTDNVVAQQNLSYPITTAPDYSTVELDTMFYTDYEINQIRFSIVSTTGLNNFNLNYSIEAIDYYAAGFADKGSAIIISGITDNLQVLVNGVTHTEAVPNAVLTQNITDQKIGDADVAEMDAAKVMFAKFSTLYRTVWPLNKYHEAIKYTRANLAGREEVAERAKAASCSSIGALLDMGTKFVKPLAKHIGNFMTEMGSEEHVFTNAFNTGTLFNGKQAWYCSSLPNEATKELEVLDANDSWSQPSDSEDYICEKCGLTKNYFYERDCKCRPGQVVNLILAHKDAKLQYDQTTAVDSKSTANCSSTVKMEDLKNVETVTFAQASQTIPTLGVLMPKDGQQLARLLNLTRFQSIRKPTVFESADGIIRAEVLGHCYFPVIFNNANNETSVTAGSIYSTKDPVKIVHYKDDGPLYYDIKYSSYGKGVYVDSRLDVRGLILTPGYYSCNIPPKMPIEGQSYRAALFMSAFSIFHILVTGTMGSGVLTDVDKKMAYAAKTRRYLLIEDENNTDNNFSNMKEDELPSKNTFKFAQAKSDRFKLLVFAMSMSMTSTKEIKDFQGDTATTEAAARKKIDEMKSGIMDITVTSKVGDEVFSRTIQVDIGGACENDHRTPFDALAAYQEMVENNQGKTWNFDSNGYVNLKTIDMKDPVSQQIVRGPNLNYYGAWLSFWKRLHFDRSKTVTKFKRYIPEELKQLMRLEVIAQRWANVKNGAVKGISINDIEDDAKYSAALEAMKLLALKPSKEEFATQTFKQKTAAPKPKVKLGEHTFESFKRKPLPAPPQPQKAQPSAPAPKALPTLPPKKKQPPKVQIVEEDTVADDDDDAVDASALY